MIIWGWYLVFKEWKEFWEGENWEKGNKSGENILREGRVVRVFGVFRKRRLDWWSRGMLFVERDGGGLWLGLGFLNIG